MQRHPDGAAGVDDQDTRLVRDRRRNRVAVLQQAAARQLSPPAWMQLGGWRRVVCFEEVERRLRQRPAEGYQGCGTVAAEVRHVSPRSGAAALIKPLVER